MFKKRLLSCAILGAMALPMAVVAQDDDDESGSWEWEWNGYLKNESAFFTRDGFTNGQQNKHSNTTSGGNDAGDLMKFENSGRLFLNGIGENTSFHLDLNVIYNTEGVDENLQGYEPYTQNDWLREIYFDHTLTLGERDISLRIGKQQVVWGTADGIKLLDIVNPTDYREFNQNTFEDSRIPILMFNAETDVGENGNVQVLVTENRQNFFPGLDEDGDQGSPFIAKGVDSITGKVNGFLNVAPALGKTALAFNNFAAAFTFSPMIIGNSGIDAGTGNGDTFFGFAPNPFLGSSANLEGVSGNNFTVQNFIDGMTPFCLGSASQLPQAITSVAPTGSGGTANFVGTAGCTDLLNQVTQRTDTNLLLTQGQPPGIAYGGNDDVTNLVEPTNFDREHPNNAFEYMSEASYTTFDSFAGARSRYTRDYESHAQPNLGLRYRGSLGEGFNFSLNYLYGYDPNPSVSLSWEDSTTSQELYPFVTSAPELNFQPTALGQPPAATGNTVRTVRLCKDKNVAAACGSNPNPITNDAVYNPSQNTAVAGFNPATGAPIPSGVTPDAPARLLFTEKSYRKTSIGGSFDTAVDTGYLGDIVLRGEFVYDRGVRVPVVDRSQLGIGNITEGLKPEKTDMFKYVLGLDITVFTNLLISGQFIQFIDLDYVDRNRDTFTGAKCTIANCGRYTADPATLSLTNDLNKAEEYDNFYSLFFSKPFGEAQLGRVNNITIYEEGGGVWNRLDMEYSFSDEFIVSGEWNHYFGDRDTTFGQMHNASNLQVGFKYLIE